MQTRSNVYLNLPVVCQMQVRVVSFFFRNVCNLIEESDSYMQT